MSSNVYLIRCTSKSSSEQKTLLQSPNTRKVIGRVELDSASLFVHRDSSSFISRWSDHLSKFSIRFEFDRELFVTKVYERVFRSAVKDSLQRQRSSSRQGNDKVSLRLAKRAILGEDAQNRRRSMAIDRQIEKDSRRFRRECKILVFGTPESGKGDVIRNIKLVHQNGYTTEERMMFRYVIHRNIIDCAKSLVEAMKETGIWPESDVNGNYCNFLLEYDLDPDPETPLQNTVGQAIHALWNDPSIAEVLESGIEFHMKDSAP